MAFDPAAPADGTPPPFPPFPPCPQIDPLLIIVIIDPDGKAGTVRAIEV